MKLVGRVMGSYPEGTFFIHGNAVGADYCCDENASSMGYPRARVPYYAFAHRSGGPQRNAGMLQLLLGLQALGAEVVVLAFHDNLRKEGGRWIGNSAGTRDMVQRAEKAKVKVRLFRHAPS